ncbi:unnamed protein product [Acanthoscelides obtectus]|uniref:Uncharacterized protein n=1 Tax=Acanthoscelides obtectus TaxID=200917 RepID=A0A9P0K898_ACAOB|nr:unnamed protein product [Acanthoscelides obtectus]CAK1632292.1 hypothetical protein AOBTE_LOCUS7467 [Acanthoscelides obtectus]
MASTTVKFVKFAANVRLQYLIIIFFDILASLFEFVE